MTGLYMMFNLRASSLTPGRSLCLSTEKVFDQGRRLPFINPSSLETLRALVQEIHNSGETDPEMWKDCEVSRSIRCCSYRVFMYMDTVYYDAFYYYYLTRPDGTRSAARPEPACPIITMTSENVS